MRDVFRLFLLYDGSLVGPEMVDDGLAEEFVYVEPVRLTGSTDVIVVVLRRVAILHHAIARLTVQLNQTPRDLPQTPVPFLRMLIHVNHLLLAHRVVQAAGAESVAA